MNCSYREAFEVLFSVISVKTSLVKKKKKDIPLKNNDFRKILTISPHIQVKIKNQYTIYKIRNLRNAFCRMIIFYNEIDF